MIVVLERIELHNEYRAIKFGLIPTMNITVKIDSKAESGVVSGPPLTVTQFDPVESVRITHDTERMRQLALPKGSFSSTSAEEKKESNISSFDHVMQPKGEEVEAKEN